VSATFDHGGQLQSGWTTAVNGTGRRLELDTEATVPIHNTPLTSSEARMHLIDYDVTCWCLPNVLMVDGVITEVDHRGQLEAGDRVAVDDPALAHVRDIMRAAGEYTAPNNEGTVERVYEDGTLLIVFDDGGSAPYPASETRRIA
jgi:hypothetical protein